MKDTDTIAAIASGMTSSGVSVIRISGPEALSVGQKVFRQKKRDGFSELPMERTASHTIHYGYVVQDDEPIDEVLLLIMRAPRSFTAEDTVEVQCHGGAFVTRRVLQAVLAAGARLAEPGEFSKRAFLNGRIDLSQAEAVADVIQAKNRLALKNSVKQLRGSVLHKVKELRDRILDEVSFIEAALDDPEHIEIEGFAEKLEKENQENLQEIQRLLASAEHGRYLSQGIRTVILGKPNVGKSSLMNAFVGAERAIVTDIAGTTRDTLTEEISLGEISLQVVDTAGIRSSDDAVERIGISLAKKEASEADLILYVADASVPWDENDEQIVPLLQGKKVMALLNKSDLEARITEDEFRNRLRPAVCDASFLSVSVKAPEDCRKIEQKIKDMFFQGELAENDEIFITAERHREALQNAAGSLREVERSIAAGMPEDFFSIDLLHAYQELGYIIGEEMDEDLVNNIFKKFCMGK